MKLYLFNPANGAYLGEDFADEDPFRRGACIIPDDATTIPPPQVEAGQMPFFNVSTRRWEVRDIPSLRKSPACGTLGETPPPEESR